MKYLLPLARANTEAAVKLASAIAPLKLASRQVGALYTGWQSGAQRTRELIVERPQVYLQARSVEHNTPATPAERWRNDLKALAGMARRARKALEAGVLQQLREHDRMASAQDVERMRAEVQGLLERYDLERGDAR
jgi:hypothetical protein